MFLVFFKKAVLKKFANIHGKTPAIENYSIEHLGTNICVISSIERDHFPYRVHILKKNHRYLKKRISTSQFSLMQMTTPATLLSICFCRGKDFNN